MLFSQIFQGVLTKPDRIPPGEEDFWLKMIRNVEEPLAHGWYCVKQPSSSDLKKGVSWQDARSQEDHFFQTRSPWSELDMTLQRNLRTANLVERASCLLSDLISDK